MSETRPTDRQIETALDVLMWLHIEREGNGALRDEISHVRDELDREVAW